jgi:hypothetical protein
MHLRALKNNNQIICMCAQDVQLTHTMIHHGQTKQYLD